MSLLARESSHADFKLSPIKAMELAASKVPGAVSLAQGIPSFATPLQIRRFVQEKIEQGACDRYSLTIGLAEFREEVALALQADGLRYDPDTEIIACSGAAEGICAAVLACCEPGDEVILPNPCYTSYAGAIAMARCQARYVALDEDHNFDFRIDLIERALTKRTKAILFCSPNNPTGTLFSEHNTRALVDLALKRKLFLIVDEVYKDFYYTNTKHFTAASIPAAREQVVRICSFSKAYAMTGWRIGFVHSSSATMNRLLKYHDAMVTCAPVVSQYAAIAALRHGAEARDEFLAEFKRRRDYCITRLDQLSDVIDYQVPNAAYFVFPRIKDTHPLARDSNALAYDILDRVKLALVPGIAFGPAGESHLRISFGKELPELEQGFDRLEEYLKGAKPGSAHAGRRVSAGADSAWPKRALTRVLGRLANLYLRRYRPTLIGICGTHGKTVMKRILADELGRDFKVRAGVLSHNTAVGLPLSIFGVSAPRSVREYLAAVWRIFYSLGVRGRGEQVLILEYGVDSAADARILLGIARPDWLVISAIAGNEPGLDYAQTLEGLRELARAVSSERVFWCGTDAALQQIRGDFSSQRRLEPQSPDNGQPLVGESAQIAYNAAKRLRSELQAISNSVS